MITAPPDGGVADLAAPFTWTAMEGAQAYYLYIGSTPGAKDLVDSRELQQTMYQVADLPSGPTLYARLWTKVGGTWRSTDSTFSVASRTATLLTPLNGAINVDVSVPLQWTSVTGAQAYYLYVGSTIGAKNFVDTGEIQQTSYLAQNLPGGQMAYARLWTKHGGVWRYVDSSFVTAALVPTFLYPTPGTTVLNSVQAWSWTAVPNAQAYYLYVGTSAGAKDLVNTGEIQQPAYWPGALPAGLVHARLWAKVANAWRYTDATFTIPATVPTLTYPANGATNVDVNQPFQWTAVANSQAYYLYVGTTPGAKDVVNFGETSQTSYVATGTVPANQLLYARIWAKVGNVWRFADSTFSAAPVAATLTYPPNGASIVNSNLPASWNPIAGAQAYYLYVGSTPGAKDLLDSKELQTTTHSISGLPTGQVLFARLHTKTAGWWRFVDSTFSIADTTAPLVTITAPAGGTTVKGTAIGVLAVASDDVDVVGVQFKLNGSALGTEVTTPPYTILWDTTPTPNGTHTLTAVARDAAGNTGAAANVTVQVDNPDTTAPAIAMTAPESGTAVSGTVTMSADGSDNVGVVGVQFLLDGAAFGADRTSPPYSIAWNTVSVPKGVHTVAARARDAAGNQTISAPVSVTVFNPPPPLTIDRTAVGNRNSAATTVTTSAFSTTAASELLLAFVASDAVSFIPNVLVSRVTGAGLTWQLVLRTNVQRGTAEIWRAFAPAVLNNVTVTATLSHSVASSITVVSFKNADPSGTNGSGAIGATVSRNARPGAPTGTVVTTRGGSWVFGVGSDWDHAVGRTLGSGQTMTHQFLATSSDTTFWVQRRSAPTPASGTSVTINNTAPTGDRYNLSLVEVLPQVIPAPPTVTSATPADGAAGISVATSVTATFDQSMDPATISASTFQLRDPADALVPATVSYDAVTRTAMLAPNVVLDYSATYTVTLNTGVAAASGRPLTNPLMWSFTTSTGVPSPSQGGGGPMLVVTSAADPFSQYYAEILRAEGMNAFAVADLFQVTATVLAGYDVVVLAQQTLTDSQVTMFTDWVQGGGNLIAMRPDKKLAALLGLVDDTATLSNAYLLIDTSQPVGAGLVDQTIQFHGTADQYLVAGGRAVATLYSDATHATVFPAVTLNSVGGTGGQAAAFTYDLARSIVYTRQGNPAWAGQERDGFAPIRADDLFFGAKSGDMQPDWIDLDKVAVPQADEQQRLLANLILEMNSDRTPLPRFWYFPRGEKAVVVMTADDHARFGPLPRFNQYLALSPSGCTVDNWECIRATSYMYPESFVSDAQAVAYQAQGFEIALHPSSGCTNWTPASLSAVIGSDLAEWQSLRPSIPSPVTERTHCLVWSDYVSHANVSLSYGMRLDTNYYYWPPSWITDRPGVFTGSGMPMRFANNDGSLIDVYQAATQMTDESGQTYPFTIDSLLDNALGAAGYYGAFVANMHTDEAASKGQQGSDAIVSSALARGVPIVSVAQLLTWLDGRNSSTFGPISWTGSTLGFSVAPGSGANGLEVMVPTQVGTLNLTGITLNGSPVAFTIETIKGITYGFVTVAAGQYRATYAP